ncbi:lyase family protein [Streptomyces scabiei]|uniref:lyase family protein n=1 Tax=Streptomyces scabiei TaxID=1930 RepID=UPI0029B80958|nr:lyase family protein [Streptomyces scabiei]
MSMNAMSVGTDSGLLAPTWAGTPVAAEVTDEAWLQAMLDAEVALARAQHAVGLTPAGAVAVIAAAARAERLDLVALAHAARAAANPVVALVTVLTEAVAAKDPAAAEYVHRGSTSQDILDSAAMLIGRRVLGLIAAGGGGGGGEGGLELVKPFAEALGLAEPTLPWHTVRTPVADLGGVLQLVTGALGKFALDVQTLSRTEIGELSEPAGAGRGASSAMPQKRNPALATLIVSAARQVPAHALVLAQCLLAEDERPAGAWHAEWQPLREALRLTGGAAHTAVELAEGLIVHPGRMRANLELTGGAIVSERLNVALAPVLGKVRAKKLLTAAAAEAAATGRPLRSVLAADPDLSARFSPDRIAGLLDPARYTGAAEALVDRALRRYGELTAEP